jgi:hypothetical protein
MSRLPRQVSSERVDLLDQIARCHRLIYEVGDKEVIKLLIALKAECEQKLIHLL